MPDLIKRTRPTGIVPTPNLAPSGDRYGTTHESAIPASRQFRSATPRAVSARRYAPGHEWQQVRSPAGRKLHHLCTACERVLRWGQGDSHRQPVEGAECAEGNMASVHDVAAYILDRHGPIDTMKLQKLVYFSQAWHLVWESKPLFDERIEAWANGPVVRELFNKHRGRFRVSEWPLGDSGNLSEEDKAVIDIVLDEYGPLAGQQLSVLTHEDGPWCDARRGLESTERSNRQISCDQMQEYYTALWLSDDSVEIAKVVWDET